MRAQPNPGAQSQMSAAGESQIPELTDDARGPRRGNASGLPAATAWSRGLDVAGGGTGINRMVGAISETYGTAAGGGLTGPAGAGGCAAARDAPSAGESGEFGADGGTPGVKESGGVPAG